MLRHVALFRWKPETTAADVFKVEAALHQNLIRPIMAQREAIQYVIDRSD